MSQNKPRNILALDFVGRAFTFDPAGPGVKSWKRPRHPLSDSLFAFDMIYLWRGQWYRRAGDHFREALSPPGNAPNYARHFTREQARDWFLAADMAIPDELADLRPLPEPGSTVDGAAQETPAEEQAALDELGRTISDALDSSARAWRQLRELAAEAGENLDGPKDVMEFMARKYHYTPGVVVKLTDGQKVDMVRRTLQRKLAERKRAAKAPEPPVAPAPHAAAEEAPAVWPPGRAGDATAGHPAGAATTAEANPPIPPVAEASRSNRNGAAPQQPPARRSLKQPKPKAFTVYRYWFATGKTQTELAQDQKLMKQLGRTVGQGTVSRWLKQVKEWIEAGHVLPDLSEPHRSKPTAVDPDRLDLGGRKDGRARRQRGRRTSDRDD